MRVSILRAFLRALLGMLLAAPAAHAAFPGANGKIAFTRCSGPDPCQYDIYTINPDGSGALNLTNTANQDELRPAWSPNGQRIAIQCEPYICVMNADGSGRTTLAAAGSGSFGPAWSPDGTKLLFMALGNGDYEIYMMNADGTAVTRLTNNSVYDANPVWSPDGSKIAFEEDSSPSPGTDIHVMNPDGTQQTDLTNTPNFEGGPDWSPDSAKIVYHRQDNSVWKLYVMNRDGSAQTKLTNNDDTDPVWSPDGKKIAFTRALGAVMVMNANGGSPAQLTYGTAPAWQPLSTAAYEHPQSASSLSASLVPTFRPCGTETNPTDGQHSPPLGTQSCLPPTPGSNVARVGSTSTGSASFTVVPGDSDPTNGDQADVTLTASLGDMKTPAGGDYVPNSSGSDLTEISRLRLTDKANNYGGASGTATEYDFRVPLDCAATSDPSIGSTCSTATSADSLLPGFITEQRQTVVQAFRVRVDDAGTNGTTGDSDDRIFATQGIYVP